MNEEELINNIPIKTDNKGDLYFRANEIENLINEIKQEKDKEIDRLKHREKELKYFNDILENQNLDKAKEIERLNNSINELCWKPIEEYDKGNYDWVLIKYFDGDYECVPIVAERRWGKWYSENEMEIQFDVRYFFDMQQLDKLKGVDKD